MEPLIDEITEKEDSIGIKYTSPSDALNFGPNQFKPLTWNEIIRQLETSGVIRYGASNIVTPTGIQSGNYVEGVSGWKLESSGELKNIYGVSNAVTTTSTAEAAGTPTAVTGSSITVSVIAGNRCFLSFAGVASNSSTGDGGTLEVGIDGAYTVVAQMTSASAGGNRYTMGFGYLTNTLSAGSHTFLLRITRGAAGTFTLDAGRFSVIEVPA